MNIETGGNAIDAMVTVHFCDISKAGNMVLVVYDIQKLFGVQLVLTSEKKRPN